MEKYKREEKTKQRRETEFRVKKEKRRQEKNISLIMHEKGKVTKLQNGRKKKRHGQKRMAKLRKCEIIKN